ILPIGSQVLIKKPKEHQSKFKPLWDGPYTIQKHDLETGNYALKLPRKSRKHRWYAAELLKPWKGAAPTKIEEPETEDRSYEVNRIVDHKDNRRGRQYFVHWEGYPSSEDSWEPEHNLRDAPEAVKEYLDRPSTPQRMARYAASALMKMKLPTGITLDK